MHVCMQLYLALTVKNALATSLGCIDKRTRSIEKENTLYRTRESLVTGTV